MAARGTERKTARRARPEKTTHELLSDMLPPQNVEAERAVLGCILRDNQCMSDFMGRIKPDYFYSAAHQKIFQIMQDMFQEGKPIDVLTLGEDLARKNWLSEVGGGPAIAEMFEDVLSAANVMHYVKIVEEKAIIRGLIHASTEILRDSYDPTTLTEELLAEAEKKIFAILDRGAGASTSHIKEIVTQVFDRISHRQESDGTSVRGVPTGFYDLNEMTDGWQKSELIILAARPSMGKTALALNLVEHAAVDHKIPVLFVSLEMSEVELAERLLCSRGHVNGFQLRKGRIGSEDTQRLIHASEELSTAPIYVDDLPGQTMLRIAATARRIQLRERQNAGVRNDPNKPGGLGMIVIDYLQLIEADDKGVSRQEQISVISRRLKNLARELQVPVIALSQLNRSVEQREGHRPRISDLRESGSIEQDADVVILLHRDDMYNHDDNPGAAELIIAKQRNGPVGDVKLTFLKDQTRFVDFHPGPTPFVAGQDEF